MGWGVITYERGAFSAPEGGVLHAPASWRTERRLQSLHEQLDTVVAFYQPDVIAIESAIYVQNYRTVIALGQAMAIPMILAASTGVLAVLYKPTAVKLAVAHGGASKAEVEGAVRAVLGITEELPLDHSDALAVAICHANQADAESKIAGGF